MQHCVHKNHCCPYRTFLGRVIDFCKVTVQVSPRPRKYITILSTSTINQRTVAAWVSLAIHLLSSVVTVAMPGCSCDQAFWRKFVRSEFRLAKFLPLHRDYRLFVFTPVSDVASQLHMLVCTVSS